MTDTLTDVSLDAEVWLITTMTTTTGIHSGTFFPAAWTDGYHEAIRRNAGALIEYLIGEDFGGESDGERGSRMRLILGGAFCQTPVEDVDPFSVALGEWARETLRFGVLRTLYPIGSRWRINVDNPCFTGIRAGRTVERILYSDYPDGIRITTSAEPRLFVSIVGDDDVANGSQVYVNPWHLDSLSTVETATLSIDVVSREEHDAALAAIRRDLAARDARIAEMERDMVIVAEVFGDAADRNDLCSVYDNTVERANSRTTWLKFDERAEDEDYSCERSVEVTVWVTQRGYYRGTESPDEDDVMWHNIDTEDVLTAVREDWDADYGTTENFDAEVE